MVNSYINNQQRYFTSPTFTKPLLFQPSRGGSSSSAMSADLQLPQDFPKIHLRPTRPPSEPSPELSSDSPADLPPTTDASVPAELVDDADIDNCRTPRSDGRRIPSAVTCPPAPRKPRRSFSFKRKLTAVQFFEIVNRKEVDEFFRASFEFYEISQTKKRRSCK